MPPKKKKTTENETLKGIYFVDFIVFIKLTIIELVNTSNIPTTIEEINWTQLLTKLQNSNTSKLFIELFDKYRCLL